MVPQWCLRHSIRETWLTRSSLLHRAALRQDVNGHPCVVCPWHHYKVSCDTGEKWYQAAKFIDGKLTPSGWESVGQRQRVHDVRRNAETGDIEVRLEEAPKHWVLSVGANPLLMP